MILDTLALHFDERGFEVITNLCPNTFAKRVVVFQRSLIGSNAKLSRMLNVVLTAQLEDETKITITKYHKHDSTTVDVDMSSPNSTETVEKLVGDALNIPVC